VDHRLKLAGRGKFCDELHSFRVFPGHTALELPTSGNGRPSHPDEVSQTDDVLKKHTVRRQQMLAAMKRGCADDVKYEVIGVRTRGDVVLRVVDHLVRTQRLHHFHVRTAAYRSDGRPKVFGQLHPSRSDAPGGTNDQNLLAGLDLPQVPEEIQRGVRPKRNG